MKILILVFVYRNCSIYIKNADKSDKGKRAQKSSQHKKAAVKMLL